jgi:hypothetical protein
MSLRHTTPSATSDAASRITANQPFSGWQDVFPDPSVTVAAMDRLVHHSTIFELNVESYRRRSADDNRRARGHHSWRSAAVLSCSAKDRT